MDSLSRGTVWPFPRFTSPGYLLNSPLYSCLHFLLFLFHLVFHRLSDQFNPTQPRASPKLHTQPPTAYWSRQHPRPRSIKIWRATLVLRNLSRIILIHPVVSNAVATDAYSLPEPSQHLNSRRPSTVTSPDLADYNSIPRPLPCVNLFHLSIDFRVPY